VLPDLRNFQGTMGTPLQTGDAGVKQTLHVIRQLVDDAVKDPFVNRAAIEIVRGVPQFDRNAKAQAIYNAAAQRFMYVEDPVGPFGPKETLRPVRTLLQIWAGDCDDASTLIASLLGTIGIPSRLVTIAADASSPNDFSHIYPEAEISPGNWIAMDIARPNSGYGIPPTRYFRKRMWSLTSLAYQDLNGYRCSSLNGYAILGDDTALSTNLQAGASFESGIAQIISAAKGQPTTPFNYPTGTSPWAPYGGAYAPGSIVPGAGYPPTASISATPGLLWPIIIGIGLVYLVSRRH
jgi:hypothetical protein